MTLSHREITYCFETERGRVRIRWLTLNATSGPYTFYIERMKAAAPGVLFPEWEHVRTGDTKQNFSTEGLVKKSRALIDAFLIL